MRVPIGKVGIVIAFLFQVVGLAHGQEGGVNLLEAFEARKLSITALGSDPSPSNKLWYAMEGFKDLDEPDFLRLAGYKEEARKSSAHLVLKRVLSWGGLGLLVGGLTYALVHTADSADGSYGPLILGGSIFIAGDVIMVVGSFMPRNTQPIGRAMQIAREYNDTLIDRISDENATRKK